MGMFPITILLTITQLLFLLCLKILVQYLISRPYDNTSTVELTTTRPGQHAEPLRMRTTTEESHVCWIHFMYTTVP